MPGKNTLKLPPQGAKIDAVPAEALGETERKIIAAAQQEFSERGFGGARMQSIAARAGVNKALLHYYFRSKQKLYEITIKSLFIAIWTSIRTNLQSAQQPMAPRQVIRTIVAAYISALAANPGFPRMLMREFADGAGFLRTVIGDFFSSLGEIPLSVISMLQKGMKDGTVRRMGIPHIMINTIGMCVASFIFKPIVELVTEQFDHLGKFESDASYYEARIEAITTMVCDGILIKEKRQ
jgi:AcrR family transcriptional regulator